MQIQTNISGCQMSLDAGQWETVLLNNGSFTRNFPDILLGNHTVNVRCPQGTKNYEWAYRNINEKARYNATFNLKATIASAG